MMEQTLDDMDRLDDLDLDLFEDPFFEPLTRARSNTWAGRSASPPAITISPPPPDPPSLLFSKAIDLSPPVVALSTSPLSQEILVQYKLPNSDVTHTHTIITGKPPISPSVVNSASDTGGRVTPNKLTFYASSGESPAQPAKIEKEEDCNVNGVVSDSVRIISKPVVHTGGCTKKNPWGSVSYAELITQAIYSVPDKRLTLSQIYEWIIDNVPYFNERSDAAASAGWKNSIRHNLSLHNRFVRVQNEGAGKSSWWMVNADAIKPPPQQSQSNANNSHAHQALGRRRAASMDAGPSPLEEKRKKLRERLKTLKQQQQEKEKMTLSTTAASITAIPVATTSVTSAPILLNIVPVPVAIPMTAAAAQIQAQEQQEGAVSTTIYPVAILNVPTSAAGDPLWDDLFPSECLLNQTPVSLISTTTEGATPMETEIGTMTPLLASTTSTPSPKNHADDSSQSSYTKIMQHLGHGGFRQRSCSNASSVGGRLSPISNVGEMDLTNDTDIQTSPQGLEHVGSNEDDPPYHCAVTEELAGNLASTRIHEENLLFQLDGDTNGTLTLQSNPVPTEETMAATTSSVPMTNILLSQPVTSSMEQPVSPSLPVSPHSLNLNPTDSLANELEQSAVSPSPNYMDCVIPGTDINFDMVDLEDFLQHELDTSAVMLDTTSMNSANNMTE